jgi:hypothetical protein
MHEHCLPYSRDVSRQPNPNLRNKLQRVVLWSLFKEIQSFSTAQHGEVSSFASVGCQLRHD